MGVTTQGDTPIRLLFTCLMENNQTKNIGGETLNAQRLEKALAEAGGESAEVNTESMQTDEVPTRGSQPDASDVDMTQQTEGVDPSGQSSTETLSAKGDDPRGEFYTFTGRGQSRRFSKAIKAGCSREEAYRRAMEPPKTECDKADGEKAKQVTNIPPKEGVAGPGPKPKPAYSAVAGLTRMGIVPSQGMSKPLNKESLDEIQKAILGEIRRNRDTSINIGFEGAVSKGGWLQLNCKNFDTVTWTKKNFAAIRKTSKQDIKLVGPEELPNPHILYGFFPDCREERTKDILEFIATQNGLPLALTWQIMHRKSEGNVENIAFGVDQTSVDQLEKLRYTVSVKFTSVNLKISKRKRVEENGEGAGKSENATAIPEKRSRTEEPEPGTSGCLPKSTETSSKADPKTSVTVPSKETAALRDRLKRPLPDKKTPPRRPTTRLQQAANRAVPSQRPSLTSSRGGGAKPTKGGRRDQQQRLILDSYRPLSQ